MFRTEFGDFFQKLLLSYKFINLVDSSTFGAKMPRASAEWVGNQFIPVPPDNQKSKINAYLKTKSCKISFSINTAIKQIEKLKEYKSVLIDAAVTGKIKCI